MKKRSLSLLLASISSLVILLVSSIIANAQSSLLQSGPMLGYCEMKEVMLWVQTTEAAQVKVKYYIESNPSLYFWTDAVQTNKDSQFTAHLLCDRVMPNNTYKYEVYINDQLVLRPYLLRFTTPKVWQFREDPPVVDFIFGSCLYDTDSEIYERPGDSYGSDYQILTSMANEKANFMLWMGDNTYLREPDWNTKTGIAYRYSHMRAIPELQPLLAGMHHYAIWDDHDYGSNDSDRSFPLKKVSEEIFKNFWANPNYDLTGKGGITGKFTWADADFFLLDNRFHRTSSKHTLELGEKRHILGEDQMRWLIDALSYSKATFKFVVIGGQVLNPAKIFENHIIYEEELKTLLSSIEEAKIPGVLFLTGDRHHSVVLKLEREKAYPLYEFTISPLTSGTYGQHKEIDETARNVKGSVLVEHNYGHIRIEGPRTDRKLIFEQKDKTGKVVFQMELKASDLK